MLVSIRIHSFLENIYTMYQLAEFRWGSRAKIARENCFTLTIRSGSRFPWRYDTYDCRTTLYGEEHLKNTRWRVEILSSRHAPFGFRRRLCPTLRRRIHTRAIVHGRIIALSARVNFASTHERYIKLSSSTESKLPTHSERCRLRIASQQRLVYRSLTSENECTFTHGRSTPYTLCRPCEYRSIRSIRFESSVSSFQSMLHKASDGVVTRLRYSDRFERSLRPEPSSGIIDPYTVFLCGPA